MELMSIPESVAIALEEDCGRHTLVCGGEDLDIDELGDDLDLVTVKLQKAELHERANNDVYRTKVSRELKRAFAVSKVDFVPKTSSRRKNKPVPVQLPEVVLVLQVFKPIRMPNVQNYPRNKKFKGIFSQSVQGEVAVLGCQTLRELRGKIACVSDVVVPGDCSAAGVAATEPRANELYKSGFFFINDTFYNDMSDPSCRDYSEVIREWSRDTKRGVGPFKTGKMEEVLFEDLEIRLGYPYVYVHQGYCEHLFVFCDMRMLHPHDSQDLNDYPQVIASYPFGRRVTCMLCQKATATWVTYGNARVTDDPFLFCEICFQSYNYTADKRKIGDFQAEPFYDWNALL